MGKFKPLLEYKGKSFAQNIVEKTSTVCDRIIVVTGYNSTAVVKRLTDSLEKNIFKKINFVFNERFEQGMFTSLKKGISEAKSSEIILYHFIDQPTLPEDFYVSFVKEIDSEFDIIQPTYNGKKGHPILLGEKAKRLIASADENETLKHLLEKRNLSIKLWECGFPEVLKDFDLPEDLETIEGV